MDIEKEYKKEFHLLTQKGRLVGKWSNVYRHCKTEGIVASILSNLLTLSKEDSDTLIKAAILHDWYKRTERKRADKYGYKQYAKTSHDSYNKLINLGVDKRVAEVAHSVGSFSLKEIINSTDFIKRLMHYIDDICLGDAVVGFTKRIDSLESQAKYKKLNESGKKIHGGQTYFEVQREVAKQIQNEIEDKLKIYPDSLTDLIMTKYSSSFAPWRNRFLNVVERTVVELNIEFTNFSIGQVANGESRRRYFDPGIQGLEFADELTVTSAIVKDLIDSPFINGDLDEDNKGPMKFYKVNREIASPSGKTGSRVDITFQRINYEKILKEAGRDLLPEQKKLSAESHLISYIEAKRAKRYSNKLLSKGYIKGILTSVELKKNIKERFKAGKSHFNYILVWGIYNEDKERDNTPKNYLKLLASPKIYKLDWSIRWVPIGWDSGSDSTEKPLISNVNPVINKWCWIMLAEVNFYK